MVSGSTHKAIHFDHNHSDTYVVKVEVEDKLAAFDFGREIVEKQVLAFLKRQVPMVELTLAARIANSF